MATVTGLTAARMKEIEDASVVDGDVVGGKLILTKHDGTTKDAGSVVGPPGPQGPAGPPGIPGEVKLWPGDTLPAPGAYGTWVWADGGIYVIAEHPIAANHISDLWNTFGNAPNQLPAPPAGSFRVPDLRGLVAAGMEAMPGGSAPNPHRMSRSEAITLAKITGKETYAIIHAEMPKHGHGTTVPVSGSIATGARADQGGGHGHQISIGNTGPGYGMSNQTSFYAQAVLLKGTQGNIFGTLGDGAHSHSVSGSISGSATLTEEGTNTPHENVQPTVFVPYIVCLDG